MDNSELLDNFEELLKQRNSKKNLKLYGNKSEQFSKIAYNRQDIIRNISAQIKAIQNADCVTNKTINKELEKHKTSSFISVNALQTHEVQHKKAAKFETQFVLDTQLINVIEDVEALTTHKGMTQEFNTSFDYSHIDCTDNILKSSKDDVNARLCDVYDDTIDVYEDRDVKIAGTECLSINKVSMDDNCTELLDKCMEIEENVNVNDFITDTEINSSLIIKINKDNKSKSNSPLVYNLDAFEKFEKLAVPIIEENEDMNTVKHLINSQILGKELSIQTDFEPEFRISEIQLSPVLKISKTPKETHKQEFSKQSTSKKIKVIDKPLDSKKDCSCKQENNIESNLKIITDGVKEEKNIEIISTDFEDEILFSSDEEIDVKQTELKDLPFTCALETSFYDHSDVLDTTMYVGFQTASNKSIQISTVSFSKAKSILDDDDSLKVPTLKQLVEKCDILNGDNNCSNENQIKTEETNLDFDITEDTKFVGFKTANGKAIEISDKNMDKANKIFYDIESPKKLDCSKFEGFKTASNKNICLSEKALTRCKRVFQDIDVDDFHHNRDDDDDIFGEIPSVIEPLAKRIKHSLESNDIEGLIHKEIRDGNVNINYDGIPKIDEDIIQEFEGEMSFSDVVKKRDTNLVGFKTASNKNIAISSDALQKCKKIFDDIDLREISDENVNNNNLTPSNNSKDHNFRFNDNNVGFKSASDKVIAISDKAIERTKNIIQDIDISTDITNNVSIEKESKNIDKNINEIISDTSFIGFKTASNKNIQVSKDAITKTKDIFKGIENNDDNTIQNNIIDTIDMHMIEIAETIDLSKPSTSKERFVGFKTASNNKIKITAEALTKSKNILSNLIDTKSGNNSGTGEFDAVKIIQDKNISEEFEHDFKPQTCTTELEVFEESNITEKDKYNLQNTESNSNNNNSTEFQTNWNDANTPEKKFVGFQTASNKKIQISDIALAKSKKIFEDLDSNKDQNSIHGFEKPKSNEVLNSAQDLANSKATFENFNKMVEIEKINPSPIFKGFKTASNKEVLISAKALARSKKIFEDLNENIEEVDQIQKIINRDFKDLKAGSNNKVETLVKSVLEDFSDNIGEQDDVQNNSPKPVFKGFQTASKKEVKISSEALAKSKRIFEDLDKVNKSPNEVVRHTNPTFKGFQTASNKKVKISGDALARSRKIFEDIEISVDKNVNDNSTKETILEIDKSTKPTFVGFQTASNKKVEISTEALAKSKKLFDDLELVNNYIIDKKPQSPGKKYRTSGFIGFKTAGNKEVKISAEALAKSKKLFQDLNEFKENDSSALENKDSNHFKGFKTASNKKVLVTDEAINKGRQTLNDVKPFGYKTANNNDIQISEEALLKSKQLFTFIDNDADKIPNSGVIKLKIDHLHKSKLGINIDKLIDTQVINNFDESLNTEDFRTPDRSKRSGSPILSCPKAKKRKFTTPYKIGNFEDVKKPIIIKETETYDNNYKKHKKYTLKDLENLEKSIDAEITTDKNRNEIKLEKIEFKDKRNDITEATMTMELLKIYFFKDVNKKLIPEGWFEIHVKQIMWKLLSYEIKFPKTMAYVCTAKNVLDQLKYRYFKELYNAERPALRKIFEKDDVASKTLVLCVQDIIFGDDSATNQTELLLTDGWYSVKACIDKMLLKHVQNGKIKIGTKLSTQGAELLNCEQGVAPWEDTSLLRLKIFGNSTRRARWHTRLGYHGDAAILSRLSSVTPNGGRVSKLRVTITRVYPALYVHKFADGSTVTRSERLEHIHQMKCEADRQALVEKIYEEVEKEMADEDFTESDDVYSSKRSLDSGSQIARQLKHNKEPSQFRANLTESQNRLLASRRDKLQQHIQERIAAESATGSRDVVPLWKLRVAAEGGGRALLSIWKPNDALTELLTEGATIEIYNVVPTAVRFSELQLSAGRQTIFKKSTKQSEKITKSSNRTCYPIRHIVAHPTMITDYNEIDTIGMVIQIEPNYKDFKSHNQFQNVYLTDEEKNIICVNFWGGVKKFGYENVLIEGVVVACVNLQKRAGNTKRNVPQYRATEFAYFTKSPKSLEARKLMEVLSKQVLTNKKFVDDCVNVKNSLLKCNVSNENVSPYRFHNHDFVKNKSFIESPLARVHKSDDLNLSGLDFDSTFRQAEPQELSPQALLRKKRVNEKISKLKMYGEPPPLSPMNIINMSKHATKSYKSPLAYVSVASKSDTPVASAKNLPKNRGAIELNCSPVLSMNRVTKKGVNPVKLDFNSVAMEENNSIDHFAEEFDASPPLSLDY